MAEPSLQIEVVYALPERQWLRTLVLPTGCTAGQAVQASGLQALLPAAQQEALQLGVFGRPVSCEQVLAPGDRVEIYRPLQCDPMRARRLRAGQGRSR